MELEERLNIMVSTGRSRARASVIEVFSRDKMRGRTEAPTVTNLVWDCFDTSAEITRVAYLLLLETRIPVFLLEKEGAWYDVKKNPVTIAKE